MSVEKKKFSLGVYAAGIALIILLAVVPLVMIQDSEFGGADGVGSERVAPWLGLGLAGVRVVHVVVVV